MHNYLIVSVLEYLTVSVLYFSILRTLQSVCFVNAGNLFRYITSIQQLSGSLRTMAFTLICLAILQKHIFTYVSLYLYICKDKDAIVFRSVYKA